MKERIQKVLGNAGVASRRAVEDMVREGRIAVNGEIVTELPILVDPQKDKVQVDGEGISLKSGKVNRRFYLIMNKPKGVYCTNIAQGEQKRAIDLLPDDFRVRVYPVGLLDADAKGLLLLTNDGDLTNRLTNPRRPMLQVYRATVDGHVTNEAIATMEKGVYLIDPKSGRGSKASAGKVKIIKHVQERTVIEMTLYEGRNRDMRRILAKVGHKVRDLTRLKLGPLTIDGISPGKFRELESKELKSLQQAAREDREAAPAKKPGKKKEPRRAE